MLDKAAIVKVNAVTLGQSYQEKFCPGAKTRQKLSTLAIFVPCNRLERKFQIDHAADSGDEQACLYLMAKWYPDNCATLRKQQIRQRVKKFAIVDEEVYHKPIAG